MFITKEEIAEAEVLYSSIKFPKNSIIHVEWVSGVKLLAIFMRKTREDYAYPLIVTKRLAITSFSPVYSAHLSTHLSVMIANSLIGVKSIKKISKTDLPLYLGYTHIWPLMTKLIREYKNEPKN